MAYNPNNSNGQKTSANSAPVVLASDQSAIPVTANAGTNLNTSALALDATLTGGSQVSIAKGDVASGASDSGNPVKIGGVYNSSPSTLTTGQRGNVQLDSKGSVKIALMGADSTNAITGLPDSSDATAATSGSVRLGTIARNTVFNGTTWDRQYGDSTNGTWVNIKASTTVPVSGSVTANIGTVGTLAVESGGNLASIKTNTDNLGLSQGSTTSGQKGPVVQGAVTTAAPSYTTGQTNPLSMTTSGALRVDGSGATQPISASSLPLPSLAATSTKQSDGSQKTQVVDGSGNVIGATSNALDINIKSGNPTSITANAGTNLNTSALALDATLTGGTAKAITRGGAKGTTTAADITTTAEGSDHQAIDVQIYHGGTAKDPTSIRALTSSDVVSVQQTTASSLNAQIVGPTGPSATLSSNPVTTGGKVLVGVSGATLPTAVTTTGGVVNTMYDEYGRQIVIPNTHRKLVGSQTVSISNTTETTIITAGGANVFNDLIALIISNTSTTAVRADIRDATAGSTIFSYYIPAGDTRGISLTTPWPQTTANSAWTASLSTTPSAAVYFSATFAKNKNT